MSKKQLSKLESSGLPSHTQQVFPLAKFSEGLPEGVSMCTLPSTCQSDLLNIMTTIERCTERLWDHRGEVLEIRHFLISGSWEEVEDTGEIVFVRRLILIDTDGKAYQTPSKPARQSFARQVARFAAQPFNILPPYDPPMLVSVEAEPSRDSNKGDWLHLVANIVTESSPAVQ